MAKEIPDGNRLPTSIPKSSPEMIRTPLDESEMGARKSHVPKLARNFGVIKHVPNQG